ncbi:DMT family transporter [Kiloniella sp. EL199]|uniref:DMT family transporter n=1 Tax=Kiloniella sp. EL199 TaxID=2107581 RepID=UPI000EA08FD1|nr:DMT family transporter [Kiloniella sp. EL199]
MLSDKPRLHQYILLVMLGAIWGSSFFLIKITLESIPPVTLTAFRLFFAFLVLVSLMFILGKRFPRNFQTWRYYVLIGITGNLLPFVLISWGELHIDSGLAAILMSVIPLTALLIAHLWTEDEKMSLPKLMGAVIGFAGVVLLVGPEALNGLGDSVLGQLAVAFASFCYGASSVFARRVGLVKLDPVVNGSAILLCASMMALPVAFIVEDPISFEPTLLSVGALLMLSVVSTAIAYIILYYLLGTVGATFTALNNYLVPVFGMVWGFLFLSESYELEAFIALAVILLGIIVTQMQAKPVKRVAAEFVVSEKTGEEI